GVRGDAAAGHYTAWAALQPQESPRDSCALIAPTPGAWRAADCTAEATYICELDTAVSGPSGPEPACVHGERNGHEYWFCPSPHSFDESRSLCRSVGLDLASIDDRQENDLVRRSVNGSAFIGLNDRKREGAWKWVADDRLAFCEGDPAACS